MSRDPVVSAVNRWSRKLHRWGAIAAAAPILLIICTGLLLQLKKQVTWVQPPTQRGTGTEPGIGFDAILKAAAAVPEAEIGSWGDVLRLDIQPPRGLVKVHARNHWEVQVDLGTGAVLQSRYRRSDLIESLHDGSFFHDKAKLLVFLPCGVLLLGLWVTGVYLWALPIVAKRSGRLRRAALGKPG